MKTLPSLSKAAWLNEPRLQAVMRVITQAGGEVRVAGGAIRNSLLGVPISDVDLATTLGEGNDATQRHCHPVHVLGAGVHRDARAC